MKSFTGMVVLILSSICFLIILLPLLSLLFGTSLSSIWAVLLDREVTGSIILTFFCAMTASMLGILVGTPLAYVLSRHDFPTKKIVQTLVDLPLVIPHPVAGIALLLTFSALGSENTPIGHWTGIVIAMFFVSIPLFINVMRQAFSSVPVEMEWTSRTLGLTPAYTFFRVTLPLVRNDLLVGSLMMWARSISEFGAVVILVYHPRVISILIYDRFTSHGLEAVIPIAVILVGVSIAVFLCLRTVQRRSRWVARSSWF